MNFLEQNVNSLKGIGPKTVNYFRENNILTVKDLLFSLPKKYQIFEVIDINTITVDSKISTIGEITSGIVCKKIRNSLISLIFSMNIFGKNIKIIIFGQEFLRYKLLRGLKVVVCGTFKPICNEMIVSNVFFDEFACRIESSYGIKDISNSQMQRFINRIFMATSKEEIEDLVPQELAHKYRLLSKYDLLYKAHFPSGKNDIIQVNRRKKYEEFFLFALALEGLKYQTKKIIKEPKHFDFDLITKYSNSLPFLLTADQSQVIKEILQDLQSNCRMNRLVQGDVGSGKSIVALISAYAAILAGHQVALMAPTEILALQHYHYFNNELSKLNIRCELLTRNTKRAQRNDIDDLLRSGRINLLIGTHALIEERIMFKRLGLVIIDEQHRFGVNERMKLVEKCHNSDALFLTATPIPRTLGLTNFGDLDISSIKTMPIGRKTIITQVHDYNKIEKLFNKLEGHLESNEQIYVVVPLINESEHINAYNIDGAYELIKKRFPNNKIDYLHGQMKAEEKNQVMARFRANLSKILISTTVIEVGVDIKNATVMVIFNAERFGLSQIHQLRGRVGRNDKQSYCFLISDEIECERLKILEKCSDGFSLSNEDFLLRGPGEYLGDRQSGFDEFLYADFSNDKNIWDVAIIDAQKIFTEYTNENKRNNLIKKILTVASKQSNKLN